MKLFTTPSACTVGNTLLPSIDMRSLFVPSIWFLTVSVGLWSCSKNTSEDADAAGSGTIDGSGGMAADSGDGSRDDCQTTVNRTWPANGANDHYYRDPIVFELSDPDPTAEVWADVEGSTLVSEDGTQITFVPVDPLQPSTDYTVQLDYCYGRPEISFRTSHYGAELEATAELENAVYALEFTAGEYTVGDNAGELMNAVFQWPILVQLLDTDDPYLDVMAALGKKDSDANEQNTCARTLMVENLATSTLPLLAGGMSDQVFGAQNGLLRFDYFTFDGTIAADGMTLGGIQYAASMGVTEIADLLPEFGDVDAVCTLAANLDIPCEPCDSDEFELCIRIAAKHIRGVRVASTLVPIEEPGVHEDCDTEEGR